MRKKLLTLIGSVCLILVLAALPFMTACPAPEEEKPTPTKVIEWKWSMRATHPSIINEYADQWWADEMEKRSGGRIHIKLYYGGTLSDMRDHPEGLKAGLFEMAQVIPGLAAKAMPMQDLSYGAVGPLYDLHNSYWLHELYNHPACIAEFSKWNMRPLLAVATEGYSLLSKRPVRSLDDLEGLRVRLGASYATALTHYGAVAIMVPSSETYTALERGMVDCVAFNVASFYKFKMEEIAKYLTYDIGLGPINNVHCVSNSAWAALPDDIKEIYYQLLPEYLKRVAEAADIEEAEALEAYKAGGVELIKFPEKDKQATIEADSKYRVGDWLERVEEEGLPAHEFLEFAQEKSEEVQEPAYIFDAHAVYSNWPK